MNLFNKLPGFRRSPPGMERVILRSLLPLAAWGTLSVSLILLAVALFKQQSTLSRAEIYLMGILSLFWSGLLCVGIAAFIVMVMKGPAYVADAYPLLEMERPRAGARHQFHHQTRSSRSRGRRGKPN